MRVEVGGQRERRGLTRVEIGGAGEEEGGRMQDAGLARRAGSSGYVQFVVVWTMMI